MVMSLIESLTKIKNAVYGREVREAIHDGVFRANQIADEALEVQAYDGNSLADVTLAKDGLPTLDARIRRDVNNLENKKADKSEVTAQLAETEQQKADRSESRLKSVPITLNDADSELLAAIEGGAGTSFTLESIPREASVTPTKTTFLKYGKNLFDKFNIDTGRLINYVNGSISDNATYATTNKFIDIEPNTTYMRSGGSTAIAFYDKNYSFISGVSSSYGVFTSPSNAVYFKASVAVIRIEEAQIELGSVETDYEEFRVFIDRLDTVLKVDNVGTENIRRGAVTKEKLDFTPVEAEHTKNLFNVDTATDNYYVSQASGELASGTAYMTSDYIQVTPLTSYSFLSSSSTRIAFYTYDKVFISGALDPALPITTPENCEFIRFSFAKTVTDPSFQQFEQGDVSTPFVKYGITIPALLSEYNSEEPVLLNLPSKLYALVGQELNIYFDNIVSGKDTDYNFDVECARGEQYQNFWRFVPEVAETRPITVKVFKGNELVASKSLNIICKSASVGSGVTKKIIKLGDSTTDSENGVKKLNENFSNDVMNITALGTRGSGINKHEGRSGWNAKHYTQFADLAGVVNAFWNPSTSKFDFSYYMTQNALAVPDYVFINLGINDMFGHTTDEELDIAIASTIEQYNEMIASIHSYNSAIKISLGLTIPPNYSQDSFGKAYGSVQNRARYKRNHDFWVKKMIDVYDKRESENIYVVPILTNLDTRYNMGLEETQVNARNTVTYTSPIGNGGVHPVESGYWQIADVEWYFLKSFEP